MKRASSRHFKDKKSGYLVPPVLTAAHIKRIFGPNRKEDARERAFGDSAFAAVRRASRKRRRE